MAPLASRPTSGVRYRTLSGDDESAAVVMRQRDEGHEAVTCRNASNPTSKHACCDSNTSRFQKVSSPFSKPLRLGLNHTEYRQVNKVDVDRVVMVKASIMKSRPLTIRGWGPRMRYVSYMLVLNHLMTSRPSWWSASLSNCESRGGSRPSSVSYRLPMRSRARASSKPCCPLTSPSTPETGELRRIDAEVIRA